MSTTEKLSIIFIHVSFSFNNTKIRLAKENGDSLGKMISGGTVGFKNTRKGTEWAAQKVVEETIRMISNDYKVYDTKLILKGIGTGRNRDIVTKWFCDSQSINVKALCDKTPNKHGGCRPRKLPRK